MSIQGILTVARLELTQRARTSRWPIVLVVWFLVVGGAATLAFYATADPEIRSGRSMFDLTTFFVLGLGMLVVPALTSTSVNGDREQGVLATLQTTLLTPADIILGKLLASWCVSLVFLATALPFLVWAWIVGGVSVGSILRTLLVLVVVLAIVCAIGLMFSTLTARPVGSAVLTYLVVAFLALGTVITFGLSWPLVTQRETVRYYGIPDEYWSTAPTTENEPPPEPTSADCRHLTRNVEVGHTERNWWLLALNPFVVVADAGPGPQWPTEAQIARGDGGVAEEVGGISPMKEISRGVRQARLGPLDQERNECWFGGSVPTDDAGARERERLRQVGAVWPLGLGVLSLLGIGASAVAIRRVRTPVHRLPNGTRIA